MHYYIFLIIFVKIYLQNCLKFLKGGGIIKSSYKTIQILGGKLMKKILSVMLAIMMLFGALSISASAENLTVDSLVTEKVNNDNVLVVFNFNGGTSKYDLPVYTPGSANGTFTLTSGVGGIYYLVPGADGKSLEAGSFFVMPSVVAPEGKQFLGWECTVRDYDLVATSTFTLTKDDIFYAHALHSGVIYMTAMYESAEAEGDTMKTILGVLTKVFGTIIGILFLDGESSAGIALIEKLLGGLL